MCVDGKPSVHLGTEPVPALDRLFRDPGVRRSLVVKVWLACSVGYVAHVEWCVSFAVATVCQLATVHIHKRTSNQYQGRVENRLFMQVTGSSVDPGTVRAHRAACSGETSVD